MTVLLKGRRVTIIRKIQRRGDLHAKANELISNLEEGGGRSGRTWWKSVFDPFPEGHIHLLQKGQLELKKYFQYLSLEFVSSIYGESFVLLSLSTESSYSDVSFGIWK